MKRLVLPGALVALLACLSATVVASLRLTPPQAQMRMHNGSVWVASNQIGEATLLDGVGVEVNARIPVASNRARLAVEQAGTDAYVIDRTSGAATRIDGATLRALAPIKLMGSTASTAERDRLLVGRSTVYQLNPITGQLAAADAHSLTRRGSPLEIPSGARGITTGNGQVWLLDPHSGDLLRYSDKTRVEKRFRPSVTGAQNLVNVAGQPVLLDHRTGNASLVDADTGEVIDTLAAEMTEHDLAWGSSETQRLLIVRPRLGAVSVCRFGERACRAPVYLAAGATRLGAPVEIDDHVLVPDFGGGKVWIVDLDTMATVGSATVFGPQRRPSRFELLTRDGIVYFNDPESERAGVIELDGTVRHITKYDPAASSPTEVSRGMPTGRSTPSMTPTARRGRTGTSNPEVTGYPRTAPTGASQPGDGPPPRGLHILRLDFSPTLPEIGETVTVSAVTAGGTAQGWRWTVRRPDGSVVTSGRLPQLSHVFDATGTYEVSLTVSDGVSADTRSEKLIVIPIGPPPRCGDTITTSVRLHADLLCPPDSGGQVGALRVGADNIVIDLDGHTLASSVAGDGVGVRNGRYDRWCDCGTGHDGVTVQNGTVAGFYTAVSAAGGQAMNLVNLRLLGAGPREEGQYDSGVHLDMAWDLAIQGGTIQGYTYPVFALAHNVGLRISGVEISGPGKLSIVDSHDVLIESSSLTGVTVTYFHHYSQHSGSIVIEDNRLSQTLVDIGISANSVLRDNDVSKGQSGRGVSIRSGASGVRISGNRFVDTGLFMENGEPDDDELTGAEIVGNTFTGADAAGLFVQLPLWVRVQGMVIAENTFSDNGHRSGGLLDRNGSPVDDGLHVTATPGSDITVSGNRTSRNADHGIEAEPGTVVDGGGNVSTDDPNDCLGVVCA